MQQQFNLPCVSCANQLIEAGSLLSTAWGPFVLCEICSTLYYVDLITKETDGRPFIAIQPAKLDPTIEFEVIRYAETRVPLKEYLPKEGEEQRIINPHFKKDLKSAIEESVTPSDLIRKIKNG